MSEKELCDLNTHLNGLEEKIKSLRKKCKFTVNSYQTVTRNGNIFTNYPLKVTLPSITNTTSNNESNEDKCTKETHDVNDGSFHANITGEYESIEQMKEYVNLVSAISHTENLIADLKNW